MSFSKADPYRTSLAKAAAIADPAAAAKVFNKSELYSAIDQIGRAHQQPGESIEKARVRAQSTAEGVKVMKAYDRAKAAEPEAPPPPQHGDDVVAQIHAAAIKIMGEQKGISYAKARVLAWEQNPELKTRYASARRAP